MDTVIAVANGEVRLALELRLQAQSGVKVVGSVGSLKALTAILTGAPPAILVVDDALLGARGPAMLARVLHDTPRLGVVLLQDSVAGSGPHPLGVDAVVTCAEPPEHLVRAVLRVRDQRRRTEQRSRHRR